MKIVLAPDSFKGSLTAQEACEAMEKGIRKVFPAAWIEHVPMADGGEGTVQSLVDATQGKIYFAEVKNPLGEWIVAKYGILGDRETAVIEMAEASGLYLIPAEARNPLLTSTYGTGQLILRALDRGCRKFILGIGGSATNDGGMGMVSALGARFLDEKGEELPFGGGFLEKLARIDTANLDKRIKESTFIVACDVTNPLCGPNGASHVFGPQKGATPEMVRQLDRNLEHYAAIIKRDLGIEVKDCPGAGAAGGLGAGMMAFLGARLQPGVEIVMKAVDLEAKLNGADLVITGEGQCDFQTVKGKVPVGVGRAAYKKAVPCIVIAGSIGRGIEVLYEQGVTSIFTLVDSPMPLELAMQRAEDLLAAAAERIMRLVRSIKKGDRNGGC